METLPYLSVGLHVHVIVRLSLRFLCVIVVSVWLLSLHFAGRQHQQQTTAKLLINNCTPVYHLRN